MQYPTGKILFVVSLRGANDSWLLPEIKRTILEDGYDGVALKVLHGFRYTHTIEDMTEFFDKLRGKVQLYGWQWNLLEQPEKEAIWARKAVDEFKLNGFMSNPEGPAKKNNDGMRFYAKELKERFPNEAVGYTAYRYPSFHPEFPWDCIKFFDYHAPQVYWVGKHNPAEQLAASYKELIALKDMPVIPLGSAFTDPNYGDWKPTPADLKEFDAKCKSMKLMGCQWFTWRGAKPLGLLPVLKELNWSIDPPAPPPACDELIAEAVLGCVKEYDAIIDAIKEVHVTDKAKAVTAARIEEEEKCLDTIENLNAVHQADILKLQKTQALVLEASIKKAHNDALKSLIQPLLKP